MLSHALLLTAGLGTRLRPLSLIRAKPAIPVAGLPMVERIVGWLASAGVDDIVLNLHALPHTITSLVGDGRHFGVRARYSWEQPLVLGSAGGPRQALDIVGAETFLIVNGDTLTDLPVAMLVAAHEASDALVTMAVIPNPEPRHYSGLRVDRSGAVTGVEPRGSSNPSFHFIGVQVAHRDAFADAPPGRPSNSVGDVYMRLAESRPGSVRVYECDARFWDIGTVSDYWSTSYAFAAAGRDPGIGRVRVATGARLIESIVWDDVEIGAGATVSQCIVTDGVRVGPGANYSNLILMRGPDGSTRTAPLNVESR